MKKFSKYSSFALSGFILACLVAAYFVFPAFKDFIDETVAVILSGNTEETQAYFEKFGVWGPLAIIVFIILQMFLIVFPSWLPVIVAVMAYGLWLGVLISLTGVMLASAIGYYIGIKLQGPLQGVVGEDKLEKMDFWINNYAFGSVILFRISPLLSNDSISFIAGMLRMKFKKFMLATFCGMLPLSIAIGYFSEDISTLENGMYWIGGVGIIAYVIYILIDYKKRRKNKAND
ncbi:TVP38/TMEM64 family protein [Autumnicola psychrophila]|uniref:TVP38/TMEM64 family membrane protein n=1 Tax=Autumnicola psychrophila TaxID=3075592 RepID=A0ABU3DSP7_9FLAO|nr:VTT domain-containing protein [Zunongwangia sp. F225]MDT0686737.1 VTT domain-containing protein [Zunongwangia sp. F225]